MPNDRNEKHLDVYEDRYELHQEGETTVYYEGFQNRETQERYARINAELSRGFLEEKIQSVPSVDFTPLSEENQVLLRNMVNGITRGSPFLNPSSRPGSVFPTEADAEGSDV